MHFIVNENLNSYSVVEQLAAKESRKSGNISPNLTLFGKISATLARLSDLQCEKTCLNPNEIMLLNLATFWQHSERKWLLELEGFSRNSQ